MPSTNSIARSRAARLIFPGRPVRRWPPPSWFRSTARFGVPTLAIPIRLKSIGAHLAHKRAADWRCARSKASRVGVKRRWTALLRRGLDDLEVGECGRIVVSRDFAVKRLPDPADMVK